MLNRYDGKCADCGAWAFAGQGNVARAATGKWEVRHLICPDVADELHADEMYAIEQVMKANRAAVDAKVLSDYAADPAGTRLAIRKAMNDAARVNRLTLDDAARAATRAFAVDPAIDSIVIRVYPVPGGQFAAFHHDGATDAKPVTLLGVYASDEFANMALEARTHTGQHSLEMCSMCRVTVMGPQYWEFD